MKDQEANPLDTPKTKTRKPGKLGRPQILVDWVEIKKLAKLLCTKKEMAEHLGISDDTIARDCLREFGKPFAECYDQWTMDAKISLRRAQMKRAMRGSDRMLTWLGINHLGQKNRTDVTSGDAPLPSAQVYIPDNNRDPVQTEETGQFGDEG